METRSGQSSDSKSAFFPEATSRDLRVAAYMLFKQGFSPVDSQQWLVNGFHQQAPSVRTVQRWFARFRSGPFSFDDDEREGRPKSASDDAHVALVKELVQKDSHITIREIAHILNIHCSSVSKILKEDLGYHKKFARWVPHQLSEDQKQARLEFCVNMLERFDGGASKDVGRILTGDETYVYFYDPEDRQQSRQWLSEFEDPPVKVRRPRSIGKVMVAVFVRKSGILPPVVLDEGATVTARWYSTVCLPKVMDAIKLLRPRTKEVNLLFHHDNAPAHKAKLTQEFLSSLSLEVLNHPPYSPDLAPCDFYLFPKIKRNLKGKHFETKDDLLNALNCELNNVTLDDLSICFSTWFKRMKKCIDCDGDYFEE